MPNKCAPEWPGNNPVRSASAMLAIHARFVSVGWRSCKKKMKSPIWLLLPRRSSYQRQTEAKWRRMPTALIVEVWSRQRVTVSGIFPLSIWRARNPSRCALLMCFLNGPKKSHPSAEACRASKAIGDWELVCVSLWAKHVFYAAFAPDTEGKQDGCQKKRPSADAELPSMREMAIKVWPLYDSIPQRARASVASAFARTVAELNSPEGWQQLFGFAKIVLARQKSRKATAADSIMARARRYPRHAADMWEELCAEHAVAPRRENAEGQNFPVHDLDLPPGGSDLDTNVDIDTLPPEVAERALKLAKRGFYSRAVGALSASQALLCKHVETDARVFLTRAHQLGVAVPNGMDAIAHAVRRYARLYLCNGAARLRVLLKVDKRNAFNSCLRSDFLKIVRDEFPALYNYAVACYGETTLLLFAGIFLSSRAGCPSRRPVGTASFRARAHCDLG